MAPYEHRVVEIRGVVLPSWLALTLGIMGLCGALALVVVLQLYRADVLRLEREIRVLQVHEAAVEGVLIRTGRATAADFSAWQEEHLRRQAAGSEPDGGR